MVGTRRSKRKAAVDEVDEDVAEHIDTASTDDDDAPEEVTLGRGKEAAARQRKTEKDAKKQATLAAKERRKRQRPSTAQTGTAGGDAGAAAGVSDEASEGQELDLLPDSVIAAMAEAEDHDRRLMERRVVTEELRASLEQPPARRQQRCKFDERQAGPVTVKVLGTVGDRRGSEAAKAFLMERMHGEVKRSAEMLQPVKVGSVFVHGPKIL